MNATVSPSTTAPATVSEQRVTDFSDFQSPHEVSIERLVQAVDLAYHHPWRMMWRSFWSGFMTAIGAMVGTVIIVGLLGYMFHALGGIELLRPSIDKLQNMLTQSTTSQTQKVDTILNTNK
ncbi:hypothetical protein KGQ71_00105 [Patescibacteria group bacterium]|nr:hypothetical protein [Patescibacteria group bacterium]